MSGLIAMLTDFGRQDIYVGVMKGVMLSIFPDARFIDITHEIQPQNVRQGAFALLNSYRYFPKGTIFLVVVDPGVGTARKPIMVETDDCTFVAPDNGVLSYVLHESAAYRVYELTDETYRLSQTSATFHGRDIFAPAAAHLAGGVLPSTMGVVLEQPFMLPLPAFAVQGRQVSGEVVHIDHFGNVITSIGELRWGKEGRLSLYPRLGAAGVPSMPIHAAEVIVQIGGQRVMGIVPTYDEVARGDLLALVGSNGYLEAAVNQGNAAARLDVRIGDPVEVHLGALPTVG
jgi:hypothetical protein